MYLPENKINDRCIYKEKAKLDNVADNRKTYTAGIKS